MNNQGGLQHKRWKLKQMEEMAFEERDNEGNRNELLISSLIMK